MAIFDLTQVPSTLAMQLIGNTGLFPSPLIASAQTLDRGGLKWQATYNYSNISFAKRATLMGLLASLRAQANRLRVPVYDNPKRGAYGGTPLVVGASQTGSSIDLDGVSNTSNWIRAGDYLSIVVNSEHELKMCTADANSSGGAVTVAFEPRLRASPLNNAIVHVGDGSLPAPEGIFLLANSNIGWNSRPFQQGSELSQIILTLIEDVFATQ